MIEFCGACLQSKRYFHGLLCPPNEYGYKPTPAQMPFGELIAHIVHDNQITCTAIGGTAPAAEAKPAPTDPKEMLVAALKRSIAFCTAALVTATDAKLGDMVLYYRHSSPAPRPSSVSWAIGPITTASRRSLSA